jgi:hypothetical protein
MNRSDTEEMSASRAIDSNIANTRLTGFWLNIARAVWLVLVIPSLILFVASLPVYYQLLQRACDVTAVCSNINGTLPAQGLEALSTSGFSVSEYAALLTLFWVIITATWCGIGFLIFWRRSDDWMALLAAFFLVIYGLTTQGNPPYALTLTYPLLALPLSLMNSLGFLSLLVFFLLFPNGRLVSRWMALILLLVIIHAFFSAFLSPTSPFNANNWPAWLSGPVVLVVFGAIISSQIYRFRRVSTPVQRQQTKWIILGATAAVGFVIGFQVLGFLFAFNFNSLGAQIFVSLIWPVVLLLIPLSIGFSILRYRLYDIDVLINRTLVYGSLTALLALLYFGLIFVLQYLLRGIINQNNDVAIVVSTLVIAALFQPLRHRIQRFIDRRFYRSKYDAAKTLEAFSATLRNEVDLSQLREHLLTVVQETMQPAHVSLWLRPPEHDGKHQSLWRANPPVDSKDG